MESNSTELQREQEKFYVNNVAAYYDKTSLYCSDKTVCSQDLTMFSFIDVIFGGSN